MQIGGFSAYIISDAADLSRTHLKESLYKSWTAFHLIKVTRCHEGLYLAEFEDMQYRNRVISKAPWHFKQDVLALLPLEMAPEDLDKGRCRVHLWVQLHQAPLSRLGKPAFQKLLVVLGEVIDTELEGMDKWERFARTKMAIDPDRPLLDKLPLLLPGGERYEVLVHYERLQRVCLYCARIGHEVEGCEDRNTLLSHIKSYPAELHELMRARLLPDIGKWINKDYLIPADPGRSSG
jgi:Domain of unknown function (DUF4283)/Zinc knuckle